MFGFGAQRSNRVAVLDGMYRRVIGDAVGLGTPDDPHVRRRRGDDVQTGGQLSMVPGSNDHPLARTGARRALARIGEDVGPHVEARQHVVTVFRVRRSQPDWPRRQIKPCRGIQGVKIRADDGAEVRCGKGPHV